MRHDKAQRLQVIRMLPRHSLRRKLKWSSKFSRGCGQQMLALRVVASTRHHVLFIFWQKVVTGSNAEDECHQTIVSQLLQMSTMQKPWCVQIVPGHTGQDDCSELRLEPKVPDLINVVGKTCACIMSVAHLLF